MYKSDIEADDATFDLYSVYQLLMMKIVKFILDFIHQN